MKKLIAALLLMSAGVSAYAEVAGNVAITSDYRFRGISQSDRDPALQGGFDWAHDSGFYLGTWASSIDFGSVCIEEDDEGDCTETTSGGSIEWDFYGGFAGSITEEVGFDVGYMYYSYPSDNWPVDLDYQEFYGKLSFYGAEVGLIYSDDYFQSTNDFWYVYGDYSFPVNETFSIDGHLGYNDLSDEFGTGGSYLDWSIGVTASAVGLDFTLAYVDTDLSKSDCFGGTKLCEATGVLTISKSL